jgi:membrane fusion protein, multidrug efflux system
MNPNPALKFRHVAWASAAVLLAVLLFFSTRSGAKPAVHVQAPALPVVEIAQVEQRNVPIYGEWIGTLSGQVNAGVKAQVTGYLLK